MGKVLIVSSKYASDDSSPYLTNDLACELASNNCKVLAVGYGDHTLNRVSPDGLLEEVIIKINKTPKYIKYIVAWPHMFFALKRIVRDNDDITRVICFAPLSVLWPAVMAIRSIRCMFKTCIIFDIYPEHQIQIGSLPRILSPMLRAVEVLLLRYFGEITGMSSANVDAIQRIYGKAVLKKRFKILPPWGVEKITHKNDLFCPINSESHQIKIVFGGQICRGRDFDKAIYFLNLLRARGLKIKLTVFTDKMSAISLSTYIEEPYPWIEICDHLPRNEYLNALTEFDFGLIVTDPKVSLPTFPSKIVDYVAARLRCLCLIESASDFDVALPLPNIIHVNKFAFDETALKAAHVFLNSKHLYYTNEFQIASRMLSVELAAKVLLK